MALVEKNALGGKHINMPMGIEKNPKAPSWKSHSARTITVNLDSGESFSFPAVRSTSCWDVVEFTSGFLGIDAGKLHILKEQPQLTGKIKCQHHEECPSVCWIGGAKSLKKQPKQYENPIVVIGAGLGGVQCCIDLKHVKGRQNFLCLERCGDFGGHSWINVPNKFTKLQTERGTYYVEYCDTDANCPRTVGNGSVKYKTWPSRDTILQMTREGARARGLEEHTQFNCEVQKIVPKGGAGGNTNPDPFKAAQTGTKDGSYAIQWTPSNDDDAAGGLILAGAVSAWPGFLHDANTCEFPGEDDFDGYIEYSSFDKMDYTRATGKLCVMYGHGAFAIENVRTLCEFRCKKVTIVCRNRNLCGTKMTSWLVGHNENPCPATVILDSFKQMFDLVGYDVWSSPSVSTDRSRSFAYINQKTIFGVTDIYFLAGYYGLMECVVDEIKRLTHHTVHTKNLSKKIEAEVIIKAIGTAPSFKIAKQLGIKQIVGSWANGDPLRPVNLATKGVGAQNFGTFSIGPGLAPMVKCLNWFLDYPEDYSIIKDRLGVVKNDKWPAFVAEASYPLTFTMTVQTAIPGLAAEMMEMNGIKAVKTNESHPVEEYLQECKTEWKMYIKYFKEHGMVDDRPEPEYPYSVAMMREFDRRANDSWNKVPGARGDSGPKSALPEVPAQPTIEQITVKTASESMTFPAVGKVTLKDLSEMVKETLQRKGTHDLAGLVFTTKDSDNSHTTLVDPEAEVPKVIHLSGIPSLRPTPKEYEHPIVVIGAGLGGIQHMIDLKKRGRTNFIGIDRCSDFGGHSWIWVPNKFTKLQTERGTYFVEYLDSNANPPRTLGDGSVKYKTWPSRDTILQMSRESARARGLDEFVMFDTEVQKVTTKGEAFAIQYTSTKDDDGGGMMVAGAVCAWPGFLHELNTIEFPGEEYFGGYIEYSSFDKFDYTRATGKRVVMYGHGAFAIENVRTFMEFQAAKVDIVCRYRNLSGTKMTSWLVGFNHNPCPAPVILDSFKQMFDLVGYDVWNCPSVQTNAKRSYAVIQQNTIFGVTDIYFLAGYYGLMECTVDEISRLSHHAVHTKNLNKKIECECIIKAIGTAPSFKIAKQLGIKQVVGQWVDNDPLRFVNVSPKGVNAQNFGSFSIGPALAPSVKIANYFLDWPEDYAIVQDRLPIRTNDKWPAYVSDAKFMTTVMMNLQFTIPDLAIEINEMNALKATKQKESHPVEEYLLECKTEWEMYVKYFKEHGMVDDRPEPAYPYTVEMMEEFNRRADEAWSKKGR